MKDKLKKSIASIAMIGSVVLAYQTFIEMIHWC